MTSQSPGSLNRDNFGTSPWEYRDKKSFKCRCRGEAREYYMREGGGFPRVWAVMSFVSTKSLVAYRNTKGAPESELTNLLVGLMQVRISN
jgi:hypothetical protein